MHGRTASCGVISRSLEFSLYEKGGSPHTLCYLRQIPLPPERRLTTTILLIPVILSHLFPPSPLPVQVPDLVIAAQGRGCSRSWYRQVRPTRTMAILVRLAGKYYTTVSSKRHSPNFASSPALITLGVIPLALPPTNYINHADRSREHTPYHPKRHLEHCQAPLQARVGAQLPSCTFNQLLSTI